MEAMQAQKLAWDAHPHLALCGVPDLDRLQRCADHLSHLSIPFTVWREPDLGNEPTSLATGLLSGDVRRQLRKYPLLKLEGVSNDPVHHH